VILSWPLPLRFSPVQTKIELWRKRNCARMGLAFPAAQEVNKYASFGDVSTLAQLQNRDVSSESVRKSHDWCAAFVPPHRFKRVDEAIDVSRTLACTTSLSSLIGNNSEGGRADFRISVDSASARIPTQRWYWAESSGLWRTFSANRNQESILPRKARTMATSRDSNDDRTTFANQM
jgi:hypothetical protein